MGWARWGRGVLRTLYRPGSNDLQTVLENGYAARLLPSGHLLFARDAELYIALRKPRDPDLAHAVARRPVAQVDRRGSAG